MPSKGKEEFPGRPSDRLTVPGLGSYPWHVPKERLLFAAALIAAGAVAREPGGGGEPTGSTAVQHDVPAVESGPENEDAAPEGIVSRASGRPAST